MYEKRKSILCNAVNTKVKDCVHVNVNVNNDVLLVKTTQPGPSSHEVWVQEKPLPAIERSRLYFWTFTLLSFM